MFKPEDGLPASDVRDIEQGPDGRLYVATGKGLFTFDGVRWTEVALGADLGFLVTLYFDGQQRLWIISREGDIGYLQRERFTLLAPLADRVGVVFPQDAAEDGIWIAGDHGLTLVRADPQLSHLHYSEARGLPANKVRGPFRIGTEQILMAHEADGQVRLHRMTLNADLRAQLTPLHPALDSVASVHAAHDERGLWIATTGDAVYRYADGRLSRHESGGAAAAHRTAEPGDLLMSQTLMRDGSRWIIYRRPNLDHYIVRERDGVRRPLQLRRYHAFRSARFPFEDREGNVWLGTNRGLVQFVPRRVKVLRAEDGLTEEFTVPVQQSRDGSVWVGTWGGGLHRFARGAPNRIDGLGPGFHQNVRSLYEMPDGDLLVGSVREVVRLRDGTIVNRHPMRSEVRAFGHDPRGTLWVGTRRDLYRFDAESLVPDHVEAFEGAGIWTMLETPKGLWVGTETAGLFRLTADSLEHYGATSGLPSDFIVHAYEDSREGLWFCTYDDGIVRFSSGRFAAVSVAEGLHSAGIWRMLEDRLGGVWMTSDQGLARVDLDQLHAVADAIERGDAHPPRLRPVVFREPEGLPSRESNRGFPGGWRLADGRLVFNNLNGLLVVDPEQAMAADPAPGTAITAVYADGQAVALPRDAGARSEDPEPRLPTGTRHAGFEFAALAYEAPEQNRYQYRLDGFDDDWISAGTRNQAEYTNLAPGPYTFRVRGAAGIGEWGEPASYSFVLPPRLWQATWFQLAIVALILGLAALAYRARVNHLLALQHLRLRIASDLHDDIGSNLSSIALLSQMLESRPDLDGLERRQLERIHNAAEETVSALRDIIWVVNPKHDDLPALVRRMRQAASDLLPAGNYSFVAPDPVPERPLPMAFMHHAFLIFKEAVHNAAKHASGAAVHIELSTDEGELFFSVCDEGPGFDVGGTARGDGQGLRNMRRRAGEIGGDVQFGSPPSGGTIVVLSAPMA